MIFNVVNGNEPIDKKEKMCFNMNNKEEVWIDEYLFIRLFKNIEDYIIQTKKGGLKMKNNHLFIVFEGVDGVGKTTIANLLVEKLNVCYQKTPLPRLKWVANLLDKFHNPEIEAVGYFVLTAFTSLFISRQLKHQHVICDKYILNTIVAQTCLGGKLIKIIEKLRYKFLLKPDYVFCLTISDQNELIKRLKNRGNFNGNDKQLLPYWRKIQEKYLEFPEIIFINTSNKTPDEILSVVLNYVSR